MRNIVEEAMTRQEIAFKMLRNFDSLCVVLLIFLVIIRK